MMNPRAPTLKSLPKIHKKDIPIRPIVNFRNCPSFRLAKFLHGFLNKNFLFHNNRSIKNSSDLINHIHDIEINSNILMVSYDISNMYTNIPIEKTLNIIKENLEKQNKIHKNEINELINLLKIVLQYNYFQFNGKIYQQNQGLTMGSPLSGLLANIYLNYLENNFLIKLNKEIKLWVRYVDDTLVLLDKSAITPESLLNEINQQDENIKFSMEKESNNNLNFFGFNFDT